ncbi:MAG: hypothetical protein M1815_001880 [Lichina confinis]|nr:MAG: hypothetical protein M1815_001880 [Lichina confinis]
MSYYCWENEMVTAIAQPLSSRSTVKGGAQSDKFKIAKSDASDETVTLGAVQNTTVLEYPIQGGIHGAQATGNENAHELLGRCFNSVNSKFGNETLGTDADATSADKHAAEKAELTDFSDSCTTDSGSSVAVNALATKEDAKPETSAGDELSDKVSTRSVNYDSITESCGGPATVLTCIKTPNSQQDTLEEPYLSKDSPVPTLDAVTLREIARFNRIKDALSVLAPKSTMVPATFSEWLDHQLEMLIVERRTIETRYAAEVDEVFLMGLKEPVLPVMPPHDGRGAVLAQPTVWCPYPYVTGRHEASWPSIKEYEWEGDGRAKSGFGRFLPLMRVRDNATVAWHKVPIQPLLDFDQVNHRRTAEVIEWDATVGKETAGALFIDASLWKAIDEPELY